MSDKKLVEVSLGSDDDDMRVATIAYRGIIAIYPEAILEGDALFARRRNVIAIAIDGGRVFHVEPHEGETVRELWTKWSLDAA